jgi:hypothetical protein
MNSANGTRSVPRWAGELALPADPTPEEARLLAELLGAIRRVRFGSVQVHIQDGRVVQVDTVDKRRM